MGVWAIAYRARFGLSGKVRATSLRVIISGGLWGGLRWRFRGSVKVMSQCYGNG
jgi:hypothetical protein